MKCTHSLILEAIETLTLDKYSSYVLFPSEILKIWHREVKKKRMENRDTRCCCLNHVPRRYVEGQAPRACDCDPIGNRVSADVIKLKWVTLDLGDTGGMRRCAVKTAMWRWWPRLEGCGHRHQGWRGPGTIPRSHTWTSDFWPPDCGRMTFCCYKVTSL